MSVGHQRSATATYKSFFPATLNTEEIWEWKEVSLGSPGWGLPSTVYGPCQLSAMAISEGFGR